MSTKIEFSYNDAIDALAKFHCLPNNALVSIAYQTDNEDLFNDLTAYKNGNKKIPAIKELRKELNCGLKEAKEIIDDLWVGEFDAPNEFNELLHKHGF